MLGGVYGFHQILFDAGLHLDQKELYFQRYWPVHDDEVVRMHRPNLVGTQIDSKTGYDLGNWLCHPHCNEVVVN